MTIAADAKVTSKGQVTIPAEVRQALGISDGDRLQFFVHRDGRVFLQKRDRPVTAIFGRLKGAVPAAISDEDAIAAEIEERDRRSRANPVP
jgi:AbrB family looped-hinge helix DNA binding protein